MLGKFVHIKGFSLIELMVVVAIIGILAFVALPSYQRYIEDGKRAATQSFMLELASAQSNFLQDNRTYTDTLSDLNIPASDDVSNNYTVTIVVGPVTSAPSYTITASPIAGSSMGLDGDLTINHLGVKTPLAKW